MRAIFFLMGFVFLAIGCSSAAPLANNQMWRIDNEILAVDKHTVTVKDKGSTNPNPIICAQIESGGPWVVKHPAFAGKHTWFIENQGKICIRGESKRSKFLQPNLYFWQKSLNNRCDFRITTSFNGVGPERRLKPLHGLKIAQNSQSQILNSKKQSLQVVLNPQVQYAVLGYYLLNGNKVSGTVTIPIFIDGTKAIINTTPIAPKRCTAPIFRFEGN